MESIWSATPAATEEEALWRAHAPGIYRFLLGMTGDRETARDLTQETFCQAIRDLRRPAARPDNLTGWLYRIAANRATDLFRRQRRFAWIPFRPERHGGRAPDTGELLAEHDLVLQALRRLPPAAAAVLLLRDGEGFSTREIAAMLGQGHEAVRKRLARARERFRVEYQQLKGD